MSDMSAASDKKKKLKKMGNDDVKGKERKKKRRAEDEENTSQRDGSDTRKSKKAKKEIVKEQDTVEDQKKSTKKKKKKETEVDKRQSSDGAHKAKKVKSDSVPEETHRPRTRSMDAKDESRKNEPEVNGDTQNGMGSVDSSGNEMLANFPLSAEIRGLLEKRGVKSLFPIQSKTFHPIFEGQDLIGRARTGMGKTLAFVLPIVQRLSSDSSKILPRRTPRVLVMAPTRELAKQVNTDFEGMFTRGMKGVSIYGGSPYRPQEEALRSGVDVVVGTPGRIVDHINRGNLKLGKVEVLILDEADQMLDMGFKDEMESVFVSCGATKTASNRVQILLFSATMPDWVKKMASTYMSSDRIIIDLVGSSEVQASVDVRHMAVPCHWSTRASSISDLISVRGCGGSKRTIVFCQTKKDCNELSTDSNLQFEAGVIHGDITQANRESTLNAFKKGSFKVLVATDVAARGLDMIVDLVINSEPPTTASGRVDTETYVHRSGRTGRAGRKGVCITLYTPKQRGSLKEIANRIGNAFSWEGAPQPKDIIGSSVASALEDINRANEKLGGNVLAHFQGAATSLIQELGAEQALCCTLACMTGHMEEMRARSLLSNSDNFVTILFKSPHAMFHTSYVWSILRKELNPSLTQSIRGLQLTEDRMAAVFDIPAHDMAGLTHVIEKVDWLEECVELPALNIGASEYRDNLKVMGGGSRGGRFDRGGRGRGGGRRGRGWGSRGRGGRC